MDRNSLATDVLQSVLRNAKIGVVVHGVQGIDTVKVATDVAGALERTLYVAVIGYSCTTTSDRILLSTRIEDAVAWRNTPEYAGAIVVFVNGDTDKLHSLADLDRVQTRDLTLRLIKQGHDELAANAPQQRFWRALEQYAETLPLALVEDFFQAVEQERHNTDAIPANLWRLGLLRDNQLLSTNQDPALRLRRNRELLAEMGRLSDKSRRRIASALAGASDEQREHLRRAFQLLRTYYLRGDRELLRHLDLSTVETLIVAGKPGTGASIRPSSVNGDETPDSSVASQSRPLHGRRLAQFIASCFADGTEESGAALQELGEFILRRMAAPETTEPEILIESSFESQYLRPDLPPQAFREFIGRLCNPHSWGGTVQTTKESLRDAIEHATPDDIQPFDPSNPNHAPLGMSFFDLLRYFDTKLSTDQPFGRIIEGLINARNELLQYFDLLITYPLVLFRGYREAWEALNRYIDMYSELFRLFRRYDPELHHLDPNAWSYACGQLLRLEVINVCVKRAGNERTGWKAMLTPLHPLHLWRYRELVKAIGGMELTPDDRQLLIETLPDMPHLVHYLVLNPDVTGGSHVLPQSGSLEGLPTFENDSNRYLGTDGVEYILELLSRWVNQAPYSRAQIRLALVDVPDVPEAVRAVSQFLAGRSDSSVVLDLYFTRGQNSLGQLNRLDYDEDDYEITELLRSGRLRIHIHACSTRDDVAERLRRRPVHIAYFFDQTRYSIEHAPRAQELVISPLVVSHEYTFSKILGKGIIAPSAEAQDGIFADYHFVVQRVTHLPSTEQIRLQSVSNIDMSAVDNLLRDGATRWLALADRVLTNYAPSDAIPLGEKRVGQREVAVWAQSSSRLVDKFLDLLRRYNLHPSRESIIAALRRFGHVAGGGLMSLPLPSGNPELADRLEKGFIGTLLAIVWYTSRHPDSLVASLDSSIARQWLRRRAEAGRADVIGVRMSGEQIVVEAIEVKTQATDTEIRISEKNNTGGSTLDGPAITQLLNTIEVLNRIFGGYDPEPIFTPARREVLKYQLHRECFRDVHHRDWQETWYNRLKAAFALPEPRLPVTCRGLVIHVKLEEHEDITYVEDNAQGISYVKLGDQAVQNLLSQIFDTATQVTNQRTAAAHNEQNQSPQTHKDSSGRTNHSQGVSLSKTGVSRADTTLVALSDEDHDGITHTSADTGAVPTAVTSRHVRFTEGQSDEYRRVRQEAETLARLFRRACESYRIRLAECDPARAVLGPNVWRFYIRLEPGQRVEALRSALEDIGREMSRSGLLVGSIPDSNELTLDIPRSDRQVCPLRAGLERLPRVSTPEHMPIAIGVTPEGSHIASDLSSVHHMLVGGTTGAGKTMFLYSVLLSLLTTHPDPGSLRLLISTSKPEDFVFFEGLPHLETGSIVFDASEAIDLLQTHIGHAFEERLQILVNARCRDIAEYNRIHEPKLPPIVVVVDEFADLADQLSGNRVAREAFYTHLRRIAQLGRNRGVHLVLCTQRPSADLLPTNIRNLMNARVALRVNDATASRMILDEPGAEMLQFHGDMLFKEHSRVIRAQSYYVSTSELEEMLSALRR